MSNDSVFNQFGTIGVEEEFYIVDADTYRPTAGIGELVYGSEPPAQLDGHLDHELFKCVIETTTPIATSLDEVHDYVDSMREALSGFAQEHGYRIAGAGLHPAAHWRSLAPTEKKRYVKQFERVQLPQRRNLTAGVHVHVGMDDADKAIWVANELRWFCPLLLAASVNSPFWEREDTGLASGRASFLATLPNTGIPDSYDSFEAFKQYEQRLLNHGFINDRGGIWWDVRPHTGIGTVEVRAIDGQHEVGRTKRFVSMVYHAATMLAEQYEGAEGGSDITQDALATNRWRALRHGMSADVFDNDGQNRVQALDTLNQYCRQWGIPEVTWESGTLRQRSWYDDGGFDRLCKELLINWD